MHVLGFVRLACYFSAWIFGSFAWPTALICAAFHKFTPIYILIFYHAFRLVFPAKQWPAFKRAFNLNIAPYCNSQRIVFEEGASVPKPDSKVLLAVSPHGILTLGWSFLVRQCCLLPRNLFDFQLQLSGSEFFDSGMKWSVSSPCFFCFL